MAKITFSSISIENFGPFRDRQTLDLTVTSSRSVVLVKALNGSGKTTLLTALQVGLYGVKAINSVRRTEYEQLVQSLQRTDAVGHASISVGLIVDIGGVRKEVTVHREWPQKRGSFTESFSVLVGGTVDMEFTRGWDEFIGGILPAELVQLFLFDGEKIEALANPERLPDLLRRATEVFLGIGGIDVLGNDLKAIERRAALRNKDNSAEYEAAKNALLELESQAETLSRTHADLIQEQAASRNTLDQAKLALERYVAEARRGGLAAYEQAAQIRSNAVSANNQVNAVRSSIADAMSDPFLPLAWLHRLWTRYEDEWATDRQGRHAKLLTEEFKKRDRRILAALTAEGSGGSVSLVRELLKRDLDQTRAARYRKPLLTTDGDPADVNANLMRARSHIQATVASFESARRELDVSERALGEVPAEEQLADILAKMQGKSQTVAVAEQRLAQVSTVLSETQGSLSHVRARLDAARSRLSTEFKDRSLETKGLEAAARARRTLTVFKDRLLASKAHWLSEMITAEFRSLLRKRKLVSHVLVDPSSYEVTIKDGKGQELPMDRLSAGERQMLAVSVLSALIKERKGRFPVVVDTPLARLDRQHRTSLIKRFFATVSHQVIVLSTDEEVDGAAYDALHPYTNREYILDFSDELGHTTVRSDAGRSSALEVA
ncbi:DNA sulfur modification protein DndD [Paraburkholderia terricola]|uniref:DNA sulfur modification protein DndD n=1 Tax=Paraburkholderia terricola TaxID=169427 RepID=UPI00285845EB|nr:DNA sulfur modification protein DndD [Paraburkholderia terricola]MDR6496387.1 DNA sulfur modification protein DndD [Paraburkholderia terricola]